MPSELLSVLSLLSCKDSRMMGYRSAHSVCHSLSTHCVGWRQTLREICMAPLLRNERSGSSLEIANSRFQDRDGSYSPLCVIQLFDSCPVITSLVLVTLLCISSEWVKLSLQWFAKQKIISKSCPSNHRPSPYCLPTELARATPPPLCKSPWESQTGVLALWNHVFLPESLITFLTFCCFSMRSVSHYLFKPSLRSCRICETCRKHVRIFKFHINCELLILKSSGENIHKPSRHIFLIFIFF